MTITVQINERGQITIPKKMRRKGLKLLQMSMKGETYIMEPLETRDQFLEELERRSQEAKEGKVYSLDEMDRIMNGYYAKKV